MPVHTNFWGNNVLVLGSLFILSSALLALTPDRNIVFARTGQFLASHEQCEYTVTFPHPVKKRIAKAGDITTYIVESKDREAVPHLRAEFIPLYDTTTVIEKFEATLRNYAYLGGIRQPEVTMADTPIGWKGTYTGLKKYKNYDIKIYGVIYIGRVSLIHCMIVELLNTFPSESSVAFLDSIKRR